MGQSAYATDAPDFFTWSASRDDSAYWNAISGNTDWWGASREDLTQLYGTYTDTLESDIGTDTLGDNGTREYIRHYYEFNSEPWTVTADGQYTDISLSLNVGDINPVAMGTLEMSESVASGWAQLDLPSSNVVAKFVPPRAGKIRLGSMWVATGDAKYEVTVPSSFGAENNWVTVITGQEYGPGSRHWEYKQSSVINGEMGTAVGADVWVWADYAPTDGVSALVTVNVTEDSRAGSIQGTTTTSSGVTYYDYSVVNNNTYTSPLTGEEKVISEWQYDYVERQYNLVCEDGSEVKVVYGDENMTVQEGDTIETVYYGESNGSGSGDDSDGDGIGGIIADALAAIGDFIGGLIAGILSIVTSAVEALGGLIDVFNGLLDTISNFFGGFVDFLASLFPFLPEETFDILNFGLILVIAAGIIRKMFF